MIHRASSWAYNQFKTGGHHLVCMANYGSVIFIYWYNDYNNGNTYGIYVCIYIYTLWIQTLSEKVLNPPNGVNYSPVPLPKKVLGPIIYGIVLPLINIFQDGQNHQPVAIMAMDEYIWIPFLGGWTSINPSYFDVNKRGTRWLDPVANLFYNDNFADLGASRYRQQPLRSEHRQHSACWAHGQCPRPRGAAVAGPGGRGLPPGEVGKTMGKHRDKCGFLGETMGTYVEKNRCHLM